MKLVHDLLELIFLRSRQSRIDRTEQNGGQRPASADVVLDRVGELLAERSQSSGVQQAQNLIAAYRSLDDAGKAAFLIALARGYAPDAGAIRQALDAYDASPSAYALSLVTKAAEAPRQELLRRLNQAPMATAALVDMRADLLRLLKSNADIRALDDDFVHLLRSWFNRGFLVMRRIDWSSPADLLERVIRYEAVHSIGTWDELRDRLLPRDRRCYGFFHPALGDEPLIFVEVALVATTPRSIQSLLARDRAVSDPGDTPVAVFYSISNCQPGLAGISFGQFLIKQVVDDLAGEFAWLRTFVTLSPMPGFQGWLRRAAQEGDATVRIALADGSPDATWSDDDPAKRRRLALAARYLLRERDASGGLIDPVARFHIGNGARVDRLCWRGDTSARGMTQSDGLMVNYAYDLSALEANRDAYARHRTIVAAPAVSALLDA